MDTATETFQLSPDRLVYHAGCVDAIVVDGVLYAFGGIVSFLPTEFTDTFMYYVLPIPTTNLSTETPTKRPTPNPRYTSNPTPMPTAEPTPKPTSNPTSKPTSNPTQMPTAEPTCKPTSNPTSMPTPNPTQISTAKPTPKPTSKPTPNPTSNPTLMPTAEPTPKPTSNPTSKPTPKPTPNPTSRHTPNPTPISTTKPTPKATPNPTGRPFNHVGTLTCGDTISGEYNGVPLTFVVTLPFDGSLRFNASASSFVVTDIEAFTKLNVPLQTDADNDEEVTLTDKPVGVYKFIIDGQDTQNGTFTVNIQCFTPSPTRSHTSEPTMSYNQTSPRSHSSILIAASTRFWSLIIVGFINTTLFIFCIYYVATKLPMRSRNAKMVGNASLCAAIKRLEVVDHMIVVLDIFDIVTDYLYAASLIISNNSYLIVLGWMSLMFSICGLAVTFSKYAAFRKLIAFQVNVLTKEAAEAKTQTKRDDMMNEIRMRLMDMNILSLLNGTVEDIPQTMIVLIATWGHNWNHISLLKITCSMISFTSKLCMILLTSLGCCDPQIHSIVTSYEIVVDHGED
eukprot:49620_1